MEKANKIAGIVEKLASLYSAIRAHLETRNHAGIAQQRWRREEGMQRSSQRAMAGNNATRKGRRTGANAAEAAVTDGRTDGRTDGGVQRSGDGRAHVERKAEVVRIYGKVQGACTVQYGMVPECVSSGCCGAYTRGGS